MNAVQNFPGDRRTSRRFSRIPGTFVSSRPIGGLESERGR